MAAERGPDSPGDSAPALVEGVDYYRDDGGLLVFTEHHNRERGYCCFLACRHCPWGQAGRTRAQASADLQRRLDALEQRLNTAGVPLELRGYRNGVLAAGLPAAACATERPAPERTDLECAVRAQAAGLLTVLAVDWA